MNKRLLVLEPASDLLNTFQKALPTESLAVGNTVKKIETAAQFDVHYVADPKAALTELEQASRDAMPFAGAFVDLSALPTAQGLEFLEAVRGFDPHLLVIAVLEPTSELFELVNQKFNDDFLEHLDFVVKPVQSAQLLQKANRTVASWQRRRQLAANEAQLISSERLATIGTLARGIGNDFGNLLQTMMVKAELALQKKTPAAMEEALQYLVTHGERAASVVRNLQSLVKSESSREMVGLELPIKEATQLIEFEMKKTKVKLVLDFDKKPLPSVRMNRFEINQVFLNLMVNSVHAMEQKGGTLTVKTTTDDKGVAVAISDTGSGIPPEIIKKIWEPLFTTKAGKGSGIGLSVTRKIIENHGGKIELQSEVGKGTTFTIWLPK